MKTKKLGKKLSINKRTISSLQTNEMGKVKGGHFTDVEFCTVAICDTYVSCERCLTIP
jgi:hypothetical protein